MRFVFLKKMSFPEVNFFGREDLLNCCFLPKTKKNGVPMKNNQKNILVYPGSSQEVSILYFFRQSWP